MSDHSAGVIIFKAFVPTIKVMIGIAIGYVITKRGMFPPSSAKGVSILSLNVGLPCLIFASMVSSFTPQNISAFGSLALVAFLYQVIGVFLAFVVRELFFVPVDFQWGILVLGAISNWGNLPIAVVQTLGKGQPFDGATDVQLGTAYIAVFVLMMNTLLFPCGLHKLCALDFREENLSMDAPLPFRERWAERFRSLPFRRRRRASSQAGDHDHDHESSVGTKSNDGHANVVAVRPSATAEEKVQRHQEGPNDASGDLDHDHDHAEERGENIGELKLRQQLRGGAIGGGFTGGEMPTRKTSRASSFHSMMERTRPIPPTAPLDASDISTPCYRTQSAISQRKAPLPSPSHHLVESPTAEVPPLLPTSCPTHPHDPYNYHEPLSPVPSIHKPPLSKRILAIVKGFCMPVTMALVVALPCATVLPLKSLFVDVPGWTGTKMPNAPDGNPPLYFFLEATQFFGNMSIPASLILLGASIARLTVPTRWRDLPIPAIVAMTVGKMIILPIFGIFAVQSMTKQGGIFPPADKMRVFVSILTSGTPAAINQLVVTQLYNPAGSAHTLAMFLSLQYLVMPVLSTALAAIALYVVEKQ